MPNIKPLLIYRMVYVVGRGTEHMGSHERYLEAESLSDAVGKFWLSEVTPVSAELVQVWESGLLVFKPAR